MSGVTFTFPATGGEQAGRPYFAAIVPFKHLGRMFRFDEESVPATLRAQRVLNEGRAKAIAEYILNNPDSYVLPAITASCDQSMTFESLSEEHKVGLLKIPLDATLLINDGQHRRRGIELALQSNPNLADHSVSVSLFYDQGLHASQQMFADINSHATKPSGSLNALYDLRNPFARFTLNLLDKRPAFRNKIEMEAAAPGKKSPQLWSLVAFQLFITIATGMNARNFSSYKDIPDQEARLLDFLDRCEDIPYWKPMLQGTMSAEDVRERYVISHAVFLHALGHLAGHLKDLTRMDNLQTLDPAKDSPMWENRCVVHGKMLKTTNGIKATAAVLLKTCGVPLPQDIADLDAIC